MKLLILLTALFSLNLFATNECWKPVLKDNIEICYRSEVKSSISYNLEVKCDGKRTIHRSGRKHQLKTRVTQKMSFPTLSRCKEVADYIQGKDSYPFR